MTTRTFTLAEVLSVTTGHLLCDIGKVYEILNFLTDDNLYTHQLPRALRECQPYVLAAYPQLAAVDASGVTRENWQGWLAAQEQTLGTAFTLEPMRDGVHEYRDPLTELQEMAGGKPVIVIRTDETP